MLSERMFKNKFFILCLLASILGGSWAIIGTDYPVLAPTALWLDSVGQLFIADTFHAQLVKMNMDSRIMTLVAGYPGGGFNSIGTMPATSARFVYPFGVTGDASGNIYFADTYNDRICKIDQNNILYTIAGNHTNAFHGENIAATSSMVSKPSVPWIDSNGVLYFTDWGNARIRKIDTLNNNIISTVAGTGATTYNGNNLPATSTTMYRPFGLFVDLNGTVFFANPFFGFVQRIDPTTQIVRIIAGLENATGTTYNGEGFEATSAALWLPTGLWGNTLGEIYLTELNNQRVRKVTNDGILVAFAGTGVGGYTKDGVLATLSQVNQPYGVHGNDATGDVYIADSVNNLVRQVDSNQMITTIVGVAPTPLPSRSPTLNPTPSPVPSLEPTTHTPSIQPTLFPSPPSVSPTFSPTPAPTFAPINNTLSIIIIIAPFVSIFIYWYVYNSGPRSISPEVVNVSENTKYNKLECISEESVGGNDSANRGVEMQQRVLNQNSTINSNNITNNSGNATDAQNNRVFVQPVTIISSHEHEVIGAEHYV